MNFTMTCPTHETALRRKSTQWGGRWDCPIEGCTVVAWEGKTSTPADAETRELRSECHRRFDPLWQNGATSPFVGEPGGKQARRKRAYAWLASTLGVTLDRAHFGMFTADQCRKALAEMDILVLQGATR